MGGIFIYCVILDLIILTYSKPGYNHKLDNGNQDWGEQHWYHGWHHDWYHTTRRAEIKSTTVKANGKRSSENGSSTSTPQPTIRNIAIRIGEADIPKQQTPTLKPFVSSTEPPTSKLVSETLTSIRRSTAKPPNEQTFQNAQFIPIAGPNEDKTNLNDDNKEDPKEQTFQIAQFIPNSDRNEDKINTNDNITDNAAVNSTVDNSTGDEITAEAEANIGDLESDQNPYKWHVMVYDRRQSTDGNKMYIHTYICGGTLVKTNLVISAAHCFFSEAWVERLASDFRVAAGKMYPGWEDPRDKNAQYNAIAHYRTTAIVHPCVQPDLAFLFTSEHFTFNDFVKPACVSFEYKLEYNQLRKGNFGTIATSAFLEDGSCKPSEQIHWLSLPYVEEERCSLNEIVGTTLVSRICAGTVNNFTQCDTDSGNGLVFLDNGTPYLRGIASFMPTHRICLKWTTRSFTHLGSADFTSEGEIREIFQSLTRKSALLECKNMYPSTLGTEEPKPLAVEAGNDTNFFQIQGIGSDPVPPLEGTEGRAPSFQWHVGIYSKKWSPYLQICGGSLVKRDFVISAAHCFWDDSDGKLPGTQYAVAGGKLYRPWNEARDTYAQQSDVSELILPVRFRGSATSFQDDIALVRLASPFTYAAGVRPVCVDFNVEGDREQLQSGNEGTVAGWGLTQQNGSPSQRLNFLKLPYTDLDTCFKVSSPSFHKYITSDKICAGTQSGKALCRGDSGGGLVFSASNTPFIRGIASTAANNENLCNAYVLAAFTHIYAHRSFIRQFIPDIESECDGIRDTNNEKTGNLAGVGAIGEDTGNLGAGNLGTVSGAVETGTGNVGTGIGTVGIGTGNVGADKENVGMGTGVGNVGIATPASVEATSKRRNIVPVMDTTPSYAGVPYNHFVCNCHCKN